MYPAPKYLEGPNNQQQSFDYPSNPGPHCAIPATPVHDMWPQWPWHGGHHSLASIPCFFFPIILWLKCLCTGKVTIWTLSGCGATLSGCSGLIFIYPNDPVLSGWHFGFRRSNNGGITVIAFLDFCWSMMMPRVFRRKSWKCVGNTRVIKHQ